MVEQVMERLSLFSFLGFVKVMHVFAGRPSWAHFHGKDHRTEIREFRGYPCLTIRALTTATSAIDFSICEFGMTSLFQSLNLKDFLLEIRK